jgi:signal transduction histidine kinase
MLEAIRRLLVEAGAARQVRPFWDVAARALSEVANGTPVTLEYRGVNESGRSAAGLVEQPADPVVIEWREDPRSVRATFAGVPPGVTREDLHIALEIASRLAIMVGRRAELERERHLGSFLSELSRWLLATPDRDLLLKYTMHSLMSLVVADGAYVALREPSSDSLRVVIALGQAEELLGSALPLNASATGRVVRSGQPLLTSNIFSERDIHPADGVSRAARGVMIAPLQTSAGVVGAAGVVRYQQEGAADPTGFSLGELHYFTAVAAHIASGIELAQAVQSSRQAAKRAAAIVHASPMPLSLVEAGGGVLLLNDAGRAVFGVADPGAAIGHTLQHLGLSSSEVPFGDVIARAPAQPPWHGRVLVTRPSGERRICDCTVTALSGLGSDDILVALYDRTDELRTQRDLIAREKLATVGEIASGVAHEVNNPLAAIRMEAELLKRGTREPDTDAAAGTIVREVDRAARIVRSLLRLARREDTNPTRVQLDDLVRDVAEIRQRVLRAENVEIRTKLDLSVPPILALGQELQQVVINLFTNAEHAVRGRGARPAVIQLTTQAREGWVRLTVEDSGPGVPKEIRGRIFDPFFTTKSPDEGSGLGLAICQRVVAEVGGKLWVEDSEELGGARFVVELPAAPERVDAEVIG